MNNMPENGAGLCNKFYLILILSLLIHKLTQRINIKTAFLITLGIFIMKQALLMIALTGLTVSMTTATYAGDATKGKEKSAACAACHGPDGNSANPLWPKLAGQHASYLEKQLSDFKAKKRTDPIMDEQIKAINEEDIKNLAAYFASQKTKPGIANPDQVALGQAIYKGGNTSTGVTACAACHGPTGAGNLAAKYPKVSGQQATYVAKQLKDFKSGARSNDNASIMRNIASNMSDAEIEAVSQYMTGLHD